MKMDLQEIPVKEIFADDDFNCRGHIAPIDVIDLSRDIDARGLQNPIIIQPYFEKKGFKWRIVAGYRRHKAFVILEKEIIPCIIRDDLSDSQARILNLTENLKRKDLNMLQEAKAIEKLKNYGFTMDEVSKEIGMSRGWVQIRYNILNLPDEIQKQIAAGFLNQEQIKSIHSLPKEKQFDAVKLIKEARLRGDKSRILVNSPKKNPFRKKVRLPSEIFKIMEEIVDIIGYGFYTRCMAWCAGEISDVELYRDLKEFASEKGINYEIPQEVLV